MKMEQQGFVKVRVKDSNSQAIPNILVKLVSHPPNIPPKILTSQLTDNKGVCWFSINFWGYYKIIIDEYNIERIFELDKFTRCYNGGDIIFSIPISLAGLSGRRVGSE